MDWDSIGSADAYEWPIEEDAWSALREIVGKLPEGIESPQGPEQNRRLRAFLAPHMQGGRRGDLCCWIVKDWGGIGSGDNQKLVTSFGNFSEQAVAAAASQLGFNRISSWSKIAAFAYPETYAIYDSRTAAALNRILPEGSQLFFVPQSKGKKMNALRRKKHASKGKSLTYFEYLAILNGARTRERSLLDIEMALFANSDRICGLTPE